MSRAHHLTVDLEEFFHSTLLTERIDRDAWERIPRRSPALVAWLLEMLAAREARATFFVLGWLAEREPALIRRIADEGHEIGAHSWLHRRVDALDPPAFREAVRRTRESLEDLTGAPVSGYRAPSFSIGPGDEWAFDVLLEEGYRYDSSLFPIRVHPGYGYPDAPPGPHWIERAGGRLLEVPPLTLEVAGLRLPAAGGAYLRLLPLALVEAGLRQAARRGVPGTLYVHPWDLDPDGLRLPLPPLLRHRLYGGRKRARTRLLRLLDRYRFAPVADTLARMDGAGAVPT